MKKSITSVLALAIVSAASAQLTLTSANTPHSPSYEDDRNIFTNAGAPEHGESMEYDYSNIITSSSDVIPYMPAERSGFEGFTRFSYGSTLLGGIPLFSEYYTHKDATGIYRTGSYKLPQDVGLGTITGNDSDTLNFPGNNSIFENPAFDILYPASYGSTWESEFLFEVHFNLTVAAFGLNNVPGYRLQYCQQTDSVVGSGTLKLPGGSLGSFEYPVLLVKRSLNYIDSTFLGGAPAPEALLSAFGLTQGQASVSNTYYFYSPDFERPLLYFLMSSDWENVEFSYYSPKGIEHLSTNSLNATNSNIYPNPVQSGSVLNVTLNSVYEPAKIRIISLNGTEILNETIATTHSESFSIQIPSSASNGIYICQILDQNGAIILNNMITIAE